MNKMKYIYRTDLAKWLLIAAFVAATASCADDLNAPVRITPDGKEVQVEFFLGLANEDDGYTLAGETDTRSEKELQTDGFCAQLIPRVQTRATDLKPDALYHLHVIQYKQDGTLIGSVQYVASAIIGQK